MLHVATTVQSCDARGVYDSNVSLGSGRVERDQELYVNFKLHDKWLLLS